jgi:hypothetical protein
MHHLVLALMIVLLPLRGWVGDAMATQMASAAIATETGAARAHEMAATAYFYHQNQPSEAAQAMPDCHEQIAGHSQTDLASNNDHCGTCQACQACHTVALSPSRLEVTASFTSPQLRPMRAAAFTSAAAALGQKPPIS